MTTPHKPSARAGRPPSASPAERSAELADVQRRLKQEAADRRLLASQQGTDERPAPIRHSRTRG
jgi:hypothetical protein